MLLAAVAVVAASTALATPSAFADTSATPTTPTFTGMELAHGTLFGWVPVARQHPDLILPDPPVADTPANRQFVGDLLDLATRAHPGLLDGFQRAMYSGDRDLVRSATEGFLDVLWSTSDAAGLPNNTGGGSEGLLVSITNGKPHAIHIDRARFEQWVDRVVASLGPPDVRA
jgi:hypothetical protein